MASNEAGEKIDFADIPNIKDQLTENEQKGHIGKMISYIARSINGASIITVAENVQALNKMNEHVGKVEKLLDSLTKTTYTKDEILKEAQDFHAKNCTGVMDNFDFGPHIELTKLPTSDMSEAEKIKTQILNAFKDQQRQASDEMIQKMVKANALAVTLQFIKLYMAWKVISSASNIIEDKKKFDLITKNLKRMEEMVMDLVEVCDTQPDDKSIDRKVTKINSLFTSTMSKINTIEVKIKGTVERLEVTADYAAVDVLSNTLTAASQGFQLWSAFENLSSPTKWLGGLSVAAYAFFGVANVAVFLISQDKLNELRKDLREAIYLRETLEDLRQQAEDAVFKL